MQAVRCVTWHPAVSVQATSQSLPLAPAKEVLSQSFVYPVQSQPFSLACCPIRRTGKSKKSVYGIGTKHI